MAKQLNVGTFPRPPACELARRHVSITMGDHTLANSLDAFWVLETHHPPTYYIPPKDVDMSHLRPSSRTTWCEWKGKAHYYDLVTPKTGVNGGEEGEEEVLVPNVAWCYPDPTPGFAQIKDYIAFYPAAGGKYECFVDDEKVQPQPGSFYGGWVTKDVQGLVKGGRGTEGW